MTRRRGHSASQSFTPGSQKRLPFRGKVRQRRTTGGNRGYSFTAGCDDYYSGANTFYGSASSAPYRYQSSGMSGYNYRDTYGSSQPNGPTDILTTVASLDVNSRYNTSSSSRATKTSSTDPSPCISRIIPPEDRTAKYPNSIPKRPSQKPLANPSDKISLNRSYSNSLVPLQVDTAKPSCKRNLSEAELQDDRNDETSKKRANRSSQNSSSELEIQWSGERTFTKKGHNKVSEHCLQVVKDSTVLVRHESNTTRVNNLRSGPIRFNDSTPQQVLQPESGSFERKLECTANEMQHKEHAKMIENGNHQGHDNSSKTEREKNCNSQSSKIDYTALNLRNKLDTGSKLQNGILNLITPLASDVNSSSDPLTLSSPTQRHSSSCREMMIASSINESLNISSINAKEIVEENNSNEKSFFKDNKLGTSGNTIHSYTTEYVGKIVPSAAPKIAIGFSDAENSVSPTLAIKPVAKELHNKSKMHESFVGAKTSKNTAEKSKNKGISILTQSQVSAEESKPVLHKEVMQKDFSFLSAKTEENSDPNPAASLFTNETFKLYPANLPASVTTSLGLPLDSCIPYKKDESVLKSFSIFKIQDIPTCQPKLNIFEFDHTMTSTLSPNPELYSDSTYSYLFSTECNLLSWYDDVLPLLETQPTINKKIAGLECGSQFKKKHMEISSVTSVSEVLPKLNYIWSETLLAMVRSSCETEISTNVLIIGRYMKNITKLKFDLALLSNVGIGFHHVLYFPSKHYHNRPKLTILTLLDEIYSARFLWFRLVNSVTIFSPSPVQTESKQKRSFSTGKFTLSFIYTAKRCYYLEDPSTEVKSVYCAATKGRDKPLKLTLSAYGAVFRLEYKYACILQKYLRASNFLPDEASSSEYVFNFTNVFITRTKPSGKIINELTKEGSYAAAMHRHGKFGESLYVVQFIISTNNTVWEFGAPTMIVARDRSITIAAARKMFNRVDWTLSSSPEEYRFTFFSSSKLKITQP